MQSCGKMVQDHIHMWIGRWPAEDRIALLKDIPHNISNQASLLREALKNKYVQPNCRPRVSCSRSTNPLTERPHPESDQVGIHHPVV
jgi:hypothetical protein